MATKGAERRGFHTLPDALVGLTELIERTDGPAYHFVYFDVLDKISHVYGPDSTHLDAELRALFGLLEAHLRQGLGDDTLLLVTADHGHIYADPTQVAYVDERIPSLERWVHTDADGRPLTPGGSVRDMFLYLRPEHVDEAVDALTGALEDQATVHRIQQMVDDGYFGAVGDRLRRRLAPVVVLPRPGRAVWWSGSGQYKTNKRGHHGGLSRQEMEIPLLAWRP